MSREQQHKEQKKTEEYTPLTSLSRIQTRFKSLSYIQPKTAFIFPPQNTNKKTEETATSSTNLPEEVQAKMENSFGQDFSDVTIHKDSRQAEEIGAKAYTQGADIHFAPGEYQPQSKEGQELIGHELTHVVQQKQGKVGANETHGKGLEINQDVSLEKEADEAGKLASEGQQVKINNTSTSSLQKKEAYWDREITCEQSKSVKTNTRLLYKLIQNGQELWPADKKLSYHWTVKNKFGTQFINEESSEPYLNCVAKYPGDYIIETQVKNNGTAVSGMKYSYEQNIFMEQLNTELGGLSVGNFDFKYDGNVAKIDVRVKFSFDSTINNTDQVNYKARFLNAIKLYWGNHGRKIEGTTDTGSNFIIPIDIVCDEVIDNSYHKLVKVSNDPTMREHVISNINVDISTSDKTMAHEFGHALGLYDEYDGGWFENNMFWHDNGTNKKDTKALMNTGTEMRDRYFTHYLGAIESNSPKNYKYKII